MSQPESNGLFEVHSSKPQKEYGFWCLKLTEFRARDGITDYDTYNSIYEQAASGHCPYKEECPIYERTLAGQKGKYQYELEF